MSRADWIATLSRVFCGIVFIVHGDPKIMNLSGTSTFFSENFGIPGWVAIPIAILEFFGGMLLVVGLGTRILGALFIVEMLGAMLLTEHNLSFYQQLMQAMTELVKHRHDFRVSEKRRLLTYRRLLLRSCPRST